MNDDVSQLRIDFYHFILGQPNRRTGICDGDIFRVSGGPGGVITLCGQNSGQHSTYLKFLKHNNIPIFFQYITT